jgi:hypothetical protein
MTASCVATADRPTAGEIADLLTDYRGLTAAAGGWTTRIPADASRAWEARKADLLERVTAAERHDVLAGRRVAVHACMRVGDHDPHRCECGYTWSAQHDAGAEL